MPPIQEHSISFHIVLKHSSDGLYMNDFILRYFIVCVTNTDEVFLSHYLLITGCYIYKVIDFCVLHLFPVIILNSYSASEIFN